MIGCDKMLSSIELTAKPESAKQIRVIIEADQLYLDQFGMNAIRQAKNSASSVYPQHLKQLHLQGGEYHGHCDMNDGSRISWTLSGLRLHPDKFPADNKISADVKIAVAKILGVRVNRMESFFAFDDQESKAVIILKIKTASIIDCLLREYNIQGR